MGVKYRVHKAGVLVPPAAAEARSSAALLESLPAEESETTPARTGSQTLTPCLLAAVFCCVLLILLLRLYAADLRIPLQYLGDSITFLSKAKGIQQGDWIHHNSRIGMPFGADLRDFPLNITFDSFNLLLLSFIVRGPGSLINLYWILTFCASAAVATYCLIRLRVSRSVATCLGVVFALQPYGFYQGIHHLHSVYYLVPLIATAAIELVVGSEMRGGAEPKLHTRILGFLRRIPVAFWFGCIAVGLSYLYSAFFACYVLLAASALAWVRGRRTLNVCMGLFLILVICVTASLDLSPTLLHWVRDGTNPSMAFKSTAEAEIYGLKLRFLLTPIMNHPFPPFAAVRTKLHEAGFPYDNENQAAALATLGSIGLVIMIGYMLRACVLPVALSRRWQVTGTAAVLTTACIALATVGGLGDFFNVFVAPDIRCYARIGPFIEFFSIVALAMALESLYLWWRGRRLPRGIFFAGLGLLTVVGAFDQVVTSLFLPHQNHEQVFREDADFVRKVEAKMPENAEIFELPYTDFPVDGLHPRIFANDAGRPYIHSQKLRWSWGALSGTTSAEWAQWAASLPPSEMLHRTYHRGFQGIWVDTFGFAPSSPTPEPQLSALLGPPLRSANGRWLFYDSRAYNDRIRASESATDPAFKAQHPIEATFERGFYPEEHSADHVWHWAGSRGRIVLLNPTNLSRTVGFSTYIGLYGDSPQRLTIVEGGKSENIVRSAPDPYDRVVRIPPLGQAELSIRSDCRPRSPGNDSRPLCFSVTDAVAKDL